MSANSPRGFQVYDKLNFRRLLNGKIGGAAVILDSENHALRASDRACRRH